MHSPWYGSIHPSQPIRARYFSDIFHIVSDRDLFSVIVNFLIVLFIAEVHKMLCFLNRIVNTFHMKKLLFSKVYMPVQTSMISFFVATMIKFETMYQSVRGFLMLQKRPVKASLFGLPY